MSKRILVTGASGFIGSFIVEEALRQGMETWAAVRGSSSRQYLQDERIHFIELNLSSQEELEMQLKGHQFDYVVHAAGVTKCLKKEDFRRVNTEGTKNLVRALMALEMPLERFVYISSLSVFGAIREQQPYQDIREDDTPKPNTAYGRSKLEAEQWLDALNSSDESRNYREKVGELPYVVLRPTGVYGPRERDYFLMAKSIKQHVDFAVGYKKQEITFVYVRDLVNAIYASIQKTEEGALERIERQIFNVSDGQVYSSRAFSDYIQQDLGIRFLLRIKAPVWLLHVICAIGDRISQWTKKPVTLNLDKYHILRQRNWRCDITPLRQLLDFEPEWQLERGTRETIDWYVKNKWL